MPPAPLPQSSAAGAAENPSNEYEEALEKLQPLQPVLRGFNHRNRNQHRRSAWWAPYGMLRRHVDKLIDSLLELSTAAIAAAKLKNKKRKRSDDSGARAERKTRDHVRWVRDVLVPRCYLAFSQLTADNQFATLGVVLLSALAQVNAVCVRLVGEAVVEGGEGDGGALRVADNAKAIAESSSSSSKLPQSEKGGAVISRDEVARAEKLRKKDGLLKEGRGSAKPAAALDNARKDMDRNDGATSTEIQESTIPKSKTKEVDDTSSKEVSKPAKKKKKTKKRGDEFDNLFKGLF
ncbi:uncharacterized protein GGS22DRAFT_157088 [Annulohypoxylon maeteangense]|uniref:uncharacterized protein n=1 Tax=Annulohypoxylon maeteangense TaxID=1927788 RepID=UPI002007DCF9|nr:uncharacterized protein GGS22DRAFT_157088 [Annulohypoxylon maeteangense]KAI0887405.1 hypothetical protein GGS22DRAFT_157088 [Annulohypoxylon maeteangense]